MTRPNSPVQLHVQNQITRIRKKYADIFVIVAPPRSSSTALSRIFWEHPALTHYCHEPFETLYYRSDQLGNILTKIEFPLDVRSIKQNEMQSAAQRLLIKEMPYQVGKQFPLLSSLATVPIIFLIRDPRLNIASRMARKRQKGENPIFPLVESGWELLQKQIRWCETEQRDYCIVDATQFRRHPEQVLPRLFSAVGLNFGGNLLRWASRPDVSLDNLQGQHDHLYERVLRSSQLQRPSEPIPELHTFPHTGGMREHVAFSMDIYQQLQNNPYYIKTQ